MKKPEGKLVYIMPYKQGSHGATALVKALQRSHKVRDGHRIRPFAQYVNWGSSELPFIPNKLLNHPNAVKVSGNKLLTFQALQGKVSIPEFTTDREVALDWIANKDTVLARHTLVGHSGEGITIHTEGDLPFVKLYVKYKKKKKEFRVHVFKGRAIDIQEKRREREVERDEEQQKIRNRANGWVFCRDNLVVPDDLVAQSVLAVATLGLDFGAVDIIWNERDNKSYVLEVNSAPGLEGTTLEKYVEELSR